MSWRGSRRFAISRIAVSRCVAVGTIPTAIDLGLFAALIMLAGMQPDCANLLAHGCGIVISFALTRRRTHRDPRSGIAEQFTRFVVVGLASLLLSTMLVTALSTAMPALVAKILSLPAMFLWSFSVPDASFSRGRALS
jgi:putative flippase GtrA